MLADVKTKVAVWAASSRRKNISVHNQLCNLQSKNREHVVTVSSNSVQIYIKWFKVFQISRFDWVKIAVKLRVQPFWEKCHLILDSEDTLSPAISRKEFILNIKIRPKVSIIVKDNINLFAAIYTCKYRNWEKMQLLYKGSSEAVGCHGESEHMLMERHGWTKTPSELFLLLKNRCDMRCYLMFPMK